MKAVIITHSFLPLLNGMTYASISHIQDLTKLGFDVTLITGIEFCDFNRLNYSLNNVRIIKVDISGSGLPWNLVRGSIKEVVQIINSINPDYIFVEGWYNWGINVLISLPKKYKKYVFSHGSSDLKIRDIFSLLRFFGYALYDYLKEQKIYLSLDGLILLSEHVDNERFRDRGIAKKYNIPIFVLPNRNLGYILAHEINYKERVFSNFNVAIIGEMSANKNQLFISKILKDLSPLINFHLFFPTKNAYSDRVKKKLDKSPYSPIVQFYEGLDRVGINELIKNNIDLILILSRTEAQPIVIIDGLWHGIPFLSTNVGCVPSISGGRVCNLNQIKYYLNEFVNNRDFHTYYKNMAKSSSLRRSFDLAQLKMFFK